MIPSPYQGHVKKMHNLTEFLDGFKKQLGAKAIFLAVFEENDDYTITDLTDQEIRALAKDMLKFKE
jgi:hypothetical protein